MDSRIRARYMRSLRGSLTDSMTTPALVIGLVRSPRRSSHARTSARNASVPVQPSKSMRHGLGGRTTATGVVTPGGRTTPAAGKTTAAPGRAPAVTAPAAATGTAAVATGPVAAAAASPAAVGATAGGATAPGAAAASLSAAGSSGLASIKPSTVSLPSAGSTRLPGWPRFGGPSAYSPRSLPAY